MPSNKPHKNELHAPAKKRAKAVTVTGPKTRVRPDKEVQMQDRRPADTRVKLLSPMSGTLGTAHGRNIVVTLPKAVADAYVKAGGAEYYADVPLEDAVRAIKAAGGEISCDPDNKAIISACEKVAAVVGENEIDGVNGQSNINDLRAVAKTRGIKLPGSAKKADIWAAIEADADKE